MGECEIGAAASDVLELRFGLGQLKGDRVGYPKVGWSGSLASTVSVINRPDMFPPSATCRAFGPVSTPDPTTKTPGMRPFLRRLGSPPWLTRKDLSAYLPFTVAKRDHHSQDTSIAYCEPAALLRGRPCIQPRNSDVGTR